MYGGQASLGRACADLFQQASLNSDCKINFPGGVGGKVGLYQVLANYTIPILYWRKQLLYYTIPIPILYQFFRRVYSCIHVF